MRQSCQEKAAGLGVSDADCQAAMAALPLCHPKSPQPFDGHQPPVHNPNIKSNQAGVGLRDKLHQRPFFPQNVLYARRMQEDLTPSMCNVVINCRKAPTITQMSTKFENSALGLS